MKLAEIYALLSSGMLSNLSIGGDGSGTIPPEKEEMLLGHVNMGLMALHRRFVLRVKEVIVRAYDDQTFYPLKKVYADQNPTVVPRKFIADTAFDPFIEDVLKILEVFDEEGQPLVLNDPKNPDTLYTPSYDTLQITKPKSGDAYFITYQAAHTPPVSGDHDLEVDIPYVLLEPLESYVAHRVLSSMNGQEHMAKAAEHFERYNMMCMEIVDQGLVHNNTVETNTKLIERGFV